MVQNDNTMTNVKKWEWLGEVLFAAAVFTLVILFVLIVQHANDADRKTKAYETCLSHGSVAECEPILLGKR